MTEHNNAGPQLNLLSRPNDHPSSFRDHHATPLNPKTGESSRSGSLMNSTWATADPTLAQRPSDDDPYAHHHSIDRHRDHGTREDKRRSQNARTQKRRSSGQFLLSDPFDDTAIDDDTRGHRHRARRVVNKGKGVQTRHGNEQTHSFRDSGLGLGLSPDASRMRNGSAERAPGPPPRGLESNARPEHLQASPRMPSPQSSTSCLDMDSTQIVSMALNLSESRRLVQRRILSQPMPPRLVQLPTDNAVAGSLRQQLQQQRRASRVMSPNPEVAVVQGLGSGAKIASPLQPPFEPEDSYKFHFSNSTLARAQKAKDYMELLSQYRRVLELLPPLKPNSLSKTSTFSDPGHHSMPMNLNSIDTTGQIGRPYNPLQYIRNRKVRARERKTIDGEVQGFGDVNRVTDWVDDVAKWVATRQIRTPGSSALPPFAGADVLSVETSPPTNISRPSISISKPKRPRNDWVIEPADVLADIYWLEQDDHKRLLEDRNWRRVFPQDSELYRPLSRATDDASPGVVPMSPTQPVFAEAGDLTGKSAVEYKGQKADHDHHVSGSTRERARLKLQELRVFHRRSGSLHGHDHGHSHSLLRGRRHSSSSSSSDSDRHKKPRVSEDIDKDILTKQMMEMVAREAREARGSETKSLEVPEAPQLKPRPSNVILSDHLGSSNSNAPSRQHSLGESRADVSDVDNRNVISRSRTGSPFRTPRESLEVPSFRRKMSLGSESSQPNSPDYRASLRDNYFMPGIGADLSPMSSRHESPSRNPFSKVKQIFRDRSRDPTSERHREGLSDEKEDGEDVFAKVTGGAVSVESGHELKSSRSRNGSAGPEPKTTTRTTGDSHRSHRKTNSSFRLADPGSGLRSLFRGPRIDTVLKSGVTKVSELLWKKESEAEDSDSTSSISSDSESESRGRRKEAKSLSPSASFRGRPRVKQERHHDIHVTAPFVSTPDNRDDDTRPGFLVIPPPFLRPDGRRSPRFDRLKPPRIDISAASDPPSDPPCKSQKDQRMDVSDFESRRGSINTDRRRPSLALSLPSNGRRPSATGKDGRHYSISEQSLAPELAPLSRREVARLRAMMLSTGVMAMEISRRAHQSTVLDSTTSNGESRVLAALGNKISWRGITQLAPEDQRCELSNQAISQADLFPVTARVLGSAIQSSLQRLESAAETFKYRTRTEIDGPIDQLRGRLQLDLTAMTRATAEDADEVSGDVVDGQRRKVKSVLDVIDKLSRRRRRRFRWVRRAGWLALEWLLVGFMWYVWFVVMIARVFLGIGNGFVRGVRWLLWL